MTALCRGGVLPSCLARSNPIVHRPEQLVRVQSAASPNMAIDTTSTATLWATIQAAYARALEAGACRKADTRVELLHDPILNTDIVLRVSSIIKEKPIHAASRPDFGPQRTSPPDNPFLPYDPAMWVCDLSPTHTLLLNKFNLVDHHVLVITRAYQQQEAMLTPDDWAATHAVLQAMQPAGLAFFNVGPLSGASQPHKHVQIVPLPLASGLTTAPPLDACVRQACADAPKGMAGAVVPLRALPCQAFACMLPPNNSTQDPTLLLTPDGSHNLLCTRDWMVLVPRGALAGGPVAQNALCFVGTLFLRTVQELAYVKEGGWGRVLQGVGRPWGDSL